MKAKFFYDGDCPFCTRYGDILKLKDCFEVEIVNARTDKSWDKCGVNLDDGVILILNNNCYQGVEALDMLLDICKYSGVLFKLQKLVFANRFIGNIVYTVLKLLRKILISLR